jgi:transposase
MRPKGTVEHLAARRERANLLLSQGQKPADIAAVVGVTARTIRRWQKQPQSARRKRRPPGRPARLAADHLKRLERELKRGAFEHGYAGDYWTLDRVAQLIWQLFAIRYHPSGVWHVLHRMGWSCQRSQRRSIARDDDAVAHWRRYIWPQIKKVPELAGQAGRGR